MTTKNPINKINGVFLNEKVANVTGTTDATIETLFNILPIVLVISPIVILLGRIFGREAPEPLYPKNYSYRNYIKQEKKYLRGFK